LLQIAEYAVITLTIGSFATCRS